MKFVPPATIIQTPFPHACYRGAVPNSLLEAVLAEFPDHDDPGWIKYGNDREFKLEGPPTIWGIDTLDYFDLLEAAADEFAELFKVPKLHLETVGGGYHLIPPGGYLNVHTDFSVSPHSGRYRRINVLTFLNKGWGPDDGGQLELWDGDGVTVSVAPEFGTTVAFVTSASSWHGHPKPTSRWRASVAAYFFTDEPPPDYRPQSTVWHPNGGRRA